VEKTTYEFQMRGQTRAQYTVSSSSRGGTAWKENRWTPTMTRNSKRIPPRSFIRWAPTMTRNRWAPTMTRNSKGFPREVSKFKEDSPEKFQEDSPEKFQGCPREASLPSTQQFGHCTITLDGTSSTTFGGIIASYSRVINSEEVGTSPTYALAAEDDGIIEVSLTVTNNPGCMDSTPARGTTRSSSARRWRCYDSTSTR
jgi:hypothetical protein